MTRHEQEQLLRDYAAGNVSWSTPRQRGFDNYVNVLAGLGVLGLRPPMAPMDGPNAAVSPLITLAAGDALSCLTMAGVPVYIPDMVYLEVTRDMARLGRRRGRRLGPPPSGSGDDRSNNGFC